MRIFEWFVQFLWVSWYIQVLFDLQRPFHKHQWFLFSMRIMTILLISYKDLFHEDYGYPPIFLFPCETKLLNQKHKRYLLGMWRGDLHHDASFAWASHHEPLVSFYQNFFGDLLASWNLWSWHHQDCFMILGSYWLPIHL